ncbi:HNH endonuclease [Enterococcus hirae]
MTIDSFYKSKRWIKKKNAILRRYQYECQESKRYGIRVKAEMVHHIYPRKEYPELAFVNWNLLPLTHKKHNTFHDRENDEIIGEGLYWQRKRQKEFERWKKDRESPPPPFEI